MSFTKNLIIGLGGTGQQILLEAKSSILNHCGELPDGIRFLAIDTDVPDDKVINPYTQKEIAFEGSEFLRLSGNGAINVAKEAEGDWWPKDCTDWPLPGAGAAAKRMHGRAKLGLNINNVERVIKEAISAVRTVGASGPNVYQEGKIRVFIACSLAGGTGSGCWLDVANLLREELTESDRLVSLMLLGDAFEGRPGTTNKYANTVASLKELQWLLTSAVPDSSDYKEYMLYHRKMRFPDAKIFDSCFLVSKSGPYGVTDEPDAINRALGRWVYHMCGPAGEQFDRREDNIQDGYPYKRPGKGDQEPRKGVFWSLGISELVYEGTSEKARAAEDAAYRIIDEIVAGASSTGEIESIDIPDFLRRNDLQEDQDDQVIDALWTPRERDQQCNRIKAPDRDELERDSHQTLYTQWKNCCDRWPDTAKAKASQNKIAMEARSLAVLYEKRDSILAKPGGVTRAELFFGGISKELKNLENMMEKEAFEDKDRSTKRLRQAKSKFDEPISLNLFTWRKEVGSRVELLEPIFKDALKLAFESERKKVAVNLYHGLHIATREIYESVLHLKRNLNDTKERIQVLSRQRSRGLKSIFRTDLPAEVVGSGDSGGSLVDRVVARIKNDLKDSWLASDLDIDDLKNRLVEVVRGEIGDQFNESVFTRVSNKKKEDLGEILKDLFNKSAPMWSFDRGITAQNPEFQPPHSAIVTSGPSEMPNDFEELLAIGTASSEPEWCNHIGSNSLSFIQWQHGVPAFAIGCVKNMVPHYKNELLWQQVGVGFHLHADWKLSLPEIEPDSSNLEKKKTWILGMAHGLIIEERNNHIITNTIELGAPTEEGTWRYRSPGRTYQDARESFLTHRDLCNDLNDLLDIKKENEGKEDYYSTILEFKNNFSTRINEGQQLTDRQKALRDDLELLNRWLEENRD